MLLRILRKNNLHAGVVIIITAQFIFLSTINPFNKQKQEMSIYVLRNTRNFRTTIVQKLRLEDQRNVQQRDLYPIWYK